MAKEKEEEKKPPQKFNPTFLIILTLCYTLLTFLPPYGFYTYVCAFLAILGWLGLWVLWAASKDPNY